MKFSAGTAGLLALGLAAAPMVCITGCATSSVAATVNGVNIEEQTITDYIQSYRENSDLMDDQAWAQYLVDNGLTPETLREQTIDYYIQEELIKQACEEAGISVSDEEVSAQLDTIMSYYDYDEEKLAEAAKTIGYETLDDYREYVRDAMAQERLMETSVEGNDASDEEILESASAYASILNGSKKLEHILLGAEDAEKAQELKQQLNDGADFATLAEENGVSDDYDGWDVLVAQDDNVIAAVETMNVGDVSDVIEGADGNWLFITRVVDVCNTDTFDTIDQVPADIREQIAESIKQSDAQAQFSTYLEGLEESADIVINPMPEDVPYNVSLEGVEPTSGTGETSLEDLGITVDENGQAVAVEDTTVTEDGDNVEVADDIAVNDEAPESEAVIDEETVETE